MKIYENIFTQDDINQLIEYYKDQPITNVGYLPDGTLRRNIKDSNYNFENQLPYKIIHDRLESIIGAHHFTGGHYLDSHYPYRCHIDNISDFKSRDVPVYESSLHKNYGVLIPLVANEHFHTIFFDHYLDAFEDNWMQKIAESNASDLSNDIMSLIDHHPANDLAYLRHFKLDCVGHWKIGNVLVWQRNQVHCSSNFAKFGLNKQAIVLWV